MSIWHIAWSYLWNRKLTTILTILSVALGVALITSVMLMRDETERRFVAEGQSFDVAVGSPGSTTQLVLSTVYFIGQPTGVIDYSVFDQLKKTEDVAAAFPIGLGDSYQEFRIVGTNHEMLEYDWRDRVTNEPRNTYKIAEGRYFSKPFEADLGYSAAEKTGLKIGDTFVSTHGLSEAMGGEKHEKTPFTVVGILKASGSPNDRAIFCSMESIWEMHRDEEDEKKATAILLVLDSPAQRMQFIQHLKEDLKGVVAAIPINEIQKIYRDLLGPARNVLLAIGYLVAVISSISILIGLYLSILQRRRDLAIMRALGASAGEVFGAVLIEAFWVTVLGIGSGWLLGIGVTYALGVYMAATFGFAVSAFNPSPDMISAYSAVLLMGMVAGILPAWQAYRTDITHGLSEM